MGDDTHLEEVYETLTSSMTSDLIWHNYLYCILTRYNKATLYCVGCLVSILHFQPKPRAHWTKTPLLMYKKHKKWKIQLRLFVEVVEEITYQCYHC